MIKRLLLKLLGQDHFHCWHDRGSWIWREYGHGKATAMQHEQFCCKCGDTTWRGPCA